jgi:dihydrodipicolinate synthase/N-acetylneuraminate lyase
MLSILTLAMILAGQASTPAPLRVVVIEGEDAVNIIQQKTAVRPVVEVRDRNNLPVPGALVTFSIEGGKAATFSGASTLTVATNAAGQAAVTGMTPATAGAFQIQVSAAFQGQVATATIAQTNVMTAAQAAAASASVHRAHQVAQVRRVDRVPAPRAVRVAADSRRRPLP